jgi:quinoprotein glucose dehydrogenase
MNYKPARPHIFSIVLALLGFVLLVAGANLVLLGGSWWYALTGAVLIGSAILLWFRNRWGTWLYGSMLLCTLGWSIWEVGFNLWALLPRMLALTVLGFWMLTPFVQRKLISGPPPLLHKLHRLRMAAVVGVWAIIGLVGATAIGIALTRSGSITAQKMSAVPTDREAPAGDWPNYGNDIAGTRYSELTQINPGNVAHLSLAWRFRTGDMAGAGQDYNYEDTPLKIGSLLYVCTPSGLVFALDAATGTPKWRFDAQSQKFVPHLVCRGVSYYSTRPGSEECAQRLYVTTPDAKLWSLDALTGRRCLQFGDGGKVDLMSGLGTVPKGMYAITSPPVIAQGRLVIGAQILDNISTDMPSGVIRAYDAVSGKMEWAWDVGRPGRTEAPQDGDAYTRSTPNAWAPFSADERRGLVFVPTGNPSPDFWGKNRREFDERYGSSIVALDVGTGAVRWSFQTVHHDLWDNDLPAQPVLVDLPTGQGVVPAVIQGTKQGEIFILDRRTGVPIVPVTEKPAPGPSNIGEHLSTTQPASALALKPAPSPLTETMMWGMTPIDQLWCRIQYRQARYEGPYTPPDNARTVLEYPAMFGGIEWGGVSVDPVRKLLIANPNAMPFLVKMESIDSSDKVANVEHDGRVQWEVAHAGLHVIQGTGYALFFGPFLSPLKIPCMQPPWGKLYAIDLQTDKIVWERAVGTARDSGPLGIHSTLPLLIGTPQIGGTIITQSGLIFSGATADNYLRAYDIETGAELWSARLPAGGQATPMTFEAGGRQFVVIVAGGHGILGTTKGDYVLAYALDCANQSCKSPR